MRRAHAQKLCFLTILSISFACSSSPARIRPQRDPTDPCDLPEPAWTTRNTGFSETQTLELLSELRAAVENAEVAGIPTSEAAAEFSIAFSKTLEAREGATWVISEEATQAAYALREFFCFLKSKEGRLVYPDLTEA